MPTDLKAAFILHNPELTRYLKRRVGSHLAADLAQDTFLRVAEHPTTQVKDIRAYLYRIARNLLLDHTKQQVRRKTVSVPSSALAHIADNAPSPEAAADARMTLQRLQQTIGELPFKTQQIFVLARIDGLSYADVARHLGVSESSVQKHLAAAVLHITRHRNSR